MCMLSEYNRRVYACSGRHINYVLFDFIYLHVINFLKLNNTNEMKKKKQLMENYHLKGCDKIQL